MAKPNRICYCCGREYYFCPSCPDDRRDPQIYVMWDSELCKDIFTTLTNEFTKKITTSECKSKLIELGVDDMEINNSSVKNHIDRVMSYKTVVEPIQEVIEETVEVTDIKTIEMTDIAEDVENKVSENEETVINVVKNYKRKRK